MNPEFPKTPHEELEAKLTALLLGELPADEAAALRHTIEQDTQLAGLYERLKQTIELVRETAVSPNEETAEQTTALRLSDERREKLLAHFKTVAPKEFDRPRRREMEWLVPAAAAAVLLAFVGAALLPALGKAKSRAQRLTSLGSAMVENRAVPAEILEKPQPTAPAPQPPSLTIPPQATVSAGDVGVYLPAGEPLAGRSGETRAGVSQQEQLGLAGRNYFAVQPNAAPSPAVPPPVASAPPAEIVLPPSDHLADLEWAKAAEKSRTAPGSDQLMTTTLGRGDFGGSVAGGFGGGGGGGGGFGGRVPARTLGWPADAATESKPSAQLAENGRNDQKALGFDWYLGNQLAQNNKPAGGSGGGAGRGGAGGVDGVELRAAGGGPGGDAVAVRGLDIAARKREVESQPQANLAGSAAITVAPSTYNFSINGDAATAQGITNAIAQLDRAKSDADKVPVLGDVPALGRLYSGTTRDDVSNLKSAGATTASGGHLVYQLSNTVAVGGSLSGLGSPGSSELDFHGRAAGGTVSSPEEPSSATTQRGLNDDSWGRRNSSTDNQASLAVHFGDAQEIQQKLRQMFPNANNANQSSTLTAQVQQQQSTTTDALRLPPAKEASQSTDTAAEELVQRQAVRAPIVLPPRTAGSAPGTETTYAYLGRARGESAAVEGTGGTNGLQLNFQNTPIDQALSYLSNVGHFIIEMDTRVKGTITAAGKDMTGEDAVGVLSKELNKNGYGIVRDGRTLRIVNQEQAKATSAPVVIGNIATNIPNNPEIVTQVIPLNSAEAGQLAKNLAPTISPHATIIANEAGNKIIVTDTKENVERLAEEIKKVDSPAKQSVVDGRVAEKGQAAAPVAIEDRPAPRPAAPAPIPQPEVQTSDNAFSTFSLNVSDVSFKLAAASLEKGQMPEPATVRSEEFINAFDYRDPEPPPGAPIGFAWERAHYPFAHNRDLLRFSVKTAAAGRQPGRPLNLVLLLDNSGSMERADRVRIIHEALRVLATQLQPQDTLSVVTFARTARLWVDGVPGSQANAWLAQVSSLTPQGGTNLEEAMRLAYETALRHYLANGMNRVVLLTDGAANLGDVNPDALKQKVEANRKQGIALDCFGIGWEGYNDDLLEVLSRNGDGRYAFINTPEEVASEFAAKLAGALQVAASDVKVQVEFNPRRTTAYRQIGYAKLQLTKEQFRDNTVNAAQIGAAESGNALYTVEVNPNGEGPLCTVRVRYRTPGTADYYEHSWDVPYSGNAVSLEQASPAMRLAASASAFSEWLASSPFATDVTPDRLLNILGGVPEVYGADSRPMKLEWMIRQAKSVAGK